MLCLELVDTKYFMCGQELGEKYCLVSGFTGFLSFYNNIKYARRGHKRWGRHHNNGAGRVKMITRLSPECLGSGVAALEQGRVILAWFSTASLL